MNRLEINSYARRNLIPLDAMLELTYRCNLSCRHCYIRHLLNRRDGPPTLSTEAVRGLVDDLRALGTFSICLTGGEVLLRPDIFEIVQHVTARRFLFTVLTNGLEVPRFEREIRDTCVGNRLCRRFRISFYGTTPEVHEAVTGKRGSFRRAVEAILTLVRLGVPATIGYVITDLMSHQHGEMHSFASSLGADWGVIKDLIPTTAGDRSFLAKRLDLRKVEAVVAVNGARISRLVNGASTGGFDGACGMATSTIKIDPYGNVYPCSAMHEPAGNVTVTPLEQIWRHSQVMQNCRAVFATNAVYPACKDCDVKEYCVDRCPGHFQAETGDMFTPPRYFCDETRIVARHVRELKARG